jgi:Citrate lyase beta subunit
LRDVDFGNKIVSVRINGLDTHYCYRDVIDVLELGGERLDLIMIPKVGTAADLYAIDMLVTQVEQAIGRKKKIRFEVIMETALGLTNMLEIVQATERLESVHFGVADYAASMGMAVTGIGGTQAPYAMLEDTGSGSLFPADPWHYPIVQMVAACRAHGVLPVDGPFGDFSDDEAYLAQARRSQVLGCVGKWAIHPKQVALANNVFTPNEEIVGRARRIIEAMEEADRAGMGAVTLDGKLIDLASIRQAKVILAQSEMIAAQSGGQ